MRLIKAVTEMDYAAIQLEAGWDEGLDGALVHKFEVDLENGEDLGSLAVSSAGCRLLDGRHRLKARMRKGRMTGPANVYEPESIRAARIFELKVNVQRRKATAEEVAEMVKLVAEEEAEKQREIPEQSAASRNSETRSSNSKPAKSQRGRKKTPEGKAIERVAKERGVTPAAVRKSVKKAKDQENTDPVSAEMLKPPPSLSSRLSRAAVDLRAAVEKLASVFKEMEALRPGFGEKDSRWAVLGATNQALRFSRAGAASVEAAQLFMSRIEAAKNSKGSRTAPVDAHDVRQGKNQADAGDPKMATEEADLAAAEQVEAKHRDKRAEIDAAGRPMPEREARARAGFARAELVAREEDPGRIPQPTTPEGETRTCSCGSPDEPGSHYADRPCVLAEVPAVCGECGSESIADGYCHTCGTPLDVPKKPMGLTDPPKVGLKAPGKLNVVLKRGAQEVPYEEALAEADSAGVAGGPPEDDEVGY